MKDKKLPKKITKRIDKMVDLGRPKKKLSASVIIVTYNINQKEFEKTLSALESQARNDFEVIIVDNGNSWDVDKLAKSVGCVSYYLKLRENYGLNPARNIGASFAKGDILIFLDDDGIPAENFIEGHLEIYQKDDVMAARGKVLPKNEKSIMNKITGHYDLGDKPFPYYINTEGNSSIKRQLFLELEGVKESLTGAGGHEGAELSYRIAQKTGNKQSIYYNPQAIIYHDYSPNLKTYLKKQIRHKKHGQNLEMEKPQLFEFVKSFNPPNLKSKRAKLTVADRVKLRLIRLMKRIVLKFV